MLSILTATAAAPERVMYRSELAQAIAALATQLEMEWLICVDGGIDRHTDICREMQGVAVARVLPARGANGLAEARNQLLAAARHPACLFVDDDDIPLPTGIAQSLTEIDRGATWASGALTWRDHFAMGERYIAPRTDDGPYEAGAIAEVWRAHRRWKERTACPLPLMATVVRTDALRAVGGFRAQGQASDIATLMRLTEAFPGVVHEEPVFIYRQHPGQWTRHPAWARREYIERTRVITALRVPPRTTHRR